MGGLAEADARWLVSDDGRRTVDQVTAELDAGEGDLHVNSRLRDGGVASARAIAAVGAARARMQARARWADADQLLFTPEALEQASDPEVSRWRARRLVAPQVWDLCAGVGGDTLALAATGAQVTAVDRDPARLVLLEHNVAVRGLEVRTRCGDALATLPPPDVLVHVDPSRRRSGRRARRLADYEPPVGDLVVAHAGARGMAVVLSPGVSLDDPDLPDGAELEFIQVGGDLVEAVAWLGATRATATVASSTLLPGGHHRSRRGRVARLPVGDVGAYLVEVAPAAVRARLHDAIGAEIGAWRIADRRALLTVDAAPLPSPWYDVRPVEAVLPARPAAVRRWLASASPAPVEVSVHGLEADPVGFWQGLGSPPRGPTGRRIALIRTDGGARAVVCGAIADRPAT